MTFVHRVRATTIGVRGPTRHLREPATDAAKIRHGLIADRAIAVDIRILNAHVGTRMPVLRAFTIPVKFKAAERAGCSEDAGGTGDNKHDQHKTNTQL